jgi:hypothetical protein
MGERYFHNDMNVGTELDGADVTRTILKAAAAALKVRASRLISQLRDIPVRISYGSDVLKK